ncbi:class I SAM-dependent methyltransferase [Lysinibacter cavernae]|uniref:16S rRNA (Guanine1207-N2)-methyltransferase n=1 Tax=Lysinibacter cavernae TaxID=1640652 RepID=A0A7X5R2N0_9MICO|nr:class I SAM-dependent methyltransferase [Lysinibacter cavernae]NIH54553.1 16S rRNA (guanine1207-N2)-methyltransferase [Lysinibacter cavernae]
MTGDASAFPFEQLRRFPDVEAENLFAFDAADRLLLDETAEQRASTPLEQIVVIGDRYGALTLAALHDRVGDTGTTGAIRVFQDGLSGQRALAANAARLGIDATPIRELPLGESLLNQATLVLLQLPRSLDALDEIADAVARYAPQATLVAGGRIKHLSLGMNDVLLRSFGSVQASRARQKSRLLTATDAREVSETSLPFPRITRDAELGIEICAFGAAFAGAKVDPGTRLLLSVIDGAAEASRIIDLGCGTGVIATVLAQRRPTASIIATDQSAAAVRSATETVGRAGVGDRVTVLRDDGLDSQPAESADLIVLNPPFHMGATVHVGIAHKLFEHAARVLRPGGELWVVYNSHLGYRPTLERLIGPTKQVARDRVFTVTSSVRAR